MDKMCNTRQGHMHKNFESDAEAGKVSRKLLVLKSPEG